MITQKPYQKEKAAIIKEIKSKKEALENLFYKDDESILQKLAQN